MKSVIAVLLLFPAVLLADTFNLSWTPPTTRADGTTPLPAAEIAGYRIAWTYKNVEQPDVTAAPGSTHVLTTVGYGRVCVTLVTVDTDGLESDPSAATCRNVRPGKPITIKVR